MPNSVANIAALLAFQDVLPHVTGVKQLDVVGQATVCPRCFARQLHIYPDDNLSGEWAHCRKCGLAGDPLGLFASWWSVSSEEACVRLRGLGVSLPADIFTPAATTAHDRDYVARQRAANEFWHQSVNACRTRATGSIGHMQQDIISVREHSAWNHLDRRYVGYSTRRKVEDFFHPGSYRVRLRGNHNGRRSWRRGGGPGRCQIFPVGDWRDLFVIPFCDLPGRICGFGFVRNVSDPAEHDFIYKAVRLGPTNRRVKEAGLAMLPAAFVPQPDLLSDRLLVVQDWNIALTLQLRWLRENIQPLPIVACFADAKHRPESVWRTIPHRNVVIWNPTNPAAAIELAYDLDASVLLRRHEPQQPFFDLATLGRITGWDSPVSSIRRFQKIIDAAVPWHKWAWDRNRSPVGVG